MGAAVDDDEISKDPSEVISLDGIKSAYGEAIEDEVLEFYNLVNHQDDALEPGFINLFFWLAPFTIWNPSEKQPVYYPYYEQDLSVGQSGFQSSISDENTPQNYLDIIMEEHEIPFTLDDADADRTCDLKYPVPSGFVCTITQDGDNHLGYIGFRDPTPNTLGSWIQLKINCCKAYGFLTYKTFSPNAIFFTVERKDIVSCIIL
jgi:hypothetical protein